VAPPACAGHSGSLASAALIRMPGARRKKVAAWDIALGGMLVSSTFLFWKKTCGKKTNITRSYYS
jgi:hypothetical protein